MGSLPTPSVIVMMEHLADIWSQLDLHTQCELRQKLFCNFGEQALYHLDYWLDERGVELTKRSLSSDVANTNAHVEKNKEQSVDIKEK